MTWKANRLKNPFKSEMAESHFKEDGRGLTYEDYWIFVCIVGHQNYRLYNDAHWRDSDIIDKSDVWKKLMEVEHG